MVDTYPEGERRADELATAILGLWRDCAVRQTESALIFTYVMSGDTRTPTPEEVRTFLRTALRGSLVANPTVPRPPRWRRIVDWLAHPKETAA
jgi:hypothetical protein